MKFILILLIIVGCGKLDRKSDEKPIRDDRVFSDRDTAFYSEVNQFLIHEDQYNGTRSDSGNIPINFYEFLAPKEIGRCTAYNITKQKEIFIDPHWWKKASKEDREILIFHELAHCALGREHSDGEFNGVALSIMNVKHINKDYYAKFRKEYIKELFTKSINDLKIGIIDDTL